MLQHQEKRGRHVSRKIVWMTDEELLQVLLPWLRQVIAPSRASSPQYRDIYLVDGDLGLKSISSEFDGQLGAALLTEISLSLQWDVLRERCRYKQLIVRALQALKAPVLVHSPLSVSAAVRARNGPSGLWSAFLKRIVRSLPLPQEVLDVVAGFLGTQGCYLSEELGVLVARPQHAFFARFPDALLKRLRAAWPWERTRFRVLGDLAEVQVTWEAHDSVRMWASSVASLLAILRSLRKVRDPVSIVDIRGLGFVLL